MICECGHHAKAHLGERGLCGSPHGCSCNKFVKAAAVHDGLSMDGVHWHKARQDAEWLAGSEADTAERNLARCYLALKDEVAGFEDAELAAARVAAESALGEAKREYPHLIFCNSSRSQPIGPDIGCVCWNKLHRESATPSGEGQHTMYPTGAFAATPQPEPIVIPVEDGMIIRITPTIARRLMAIGQSQARCPYPACASPFDCGHLGVCLGQPQTPHDSTRCAEAAMPSDRTGLAAVRARVEEARDILSDEWWEREVGREA